jgi:hypothetical protein
MRTMTKLLLARPSTPAAGTPGRMKLRTDSLTARPVFACPDYDDDGSTFDDDINVAGESSW